MEAQFADKFPNHANNHFINFLGVQLNLEVEFLVKNNYKKYYNSSYIVNLQNSDLFDNLRNLLKLT